MEEPAITKLMGGHFTGQHERGENALKDELVEVDLEALAAERGIPLRPYQISEQITVDFPAWDKKSIQSVVAALSEGKRPGIDYVLTGRSNLWAMTACAIALRPNTVYLRTPGGILRPIVIPEQGATAPEGKIAFESQTAGDRTTVRFVADIGKQHDYDESLLPHVRLPMTTKQNHVLFSGTGSVYTSICLAEGFLGHCLSLSMRLPNEPFYTCVYTACKEKQIGDQE